MKSHKLARKHNFHGKPKGYTFDAPNDYVGQSNPWLPGVKGSPTGNKFAKALKTPKKTNTKKAGNNSKKY